MYSVKILKDSISAGGARITTFELEYWRAIHAEMMTHRVFSRNAASSRAIPIDKMIERVVNDPAMPLHWGSNQPGMQAHSEIPIERIPESKFEWLKARDEAVNSARRLSALGLHKQIVNRVLEPFMFIRVILTGTDFDNFFTLRCHESAQPEIQYIACEMRRQFNESTPQRRLPGEWHIPFIRDDEDLSAFTEAEIRQIAVGRCCRVSYLNHDGVREPSKDLELCDKLMSCGHWSPFEHLAQASDDPNDKSPDCRNFTGWFQYRALWDN